MVPQDFTGLSVTEIHYHPTADGETDGDEFEFIELRNTGTASLNLLEVTFTDGIEFCFTAATWLEAGEFMVLASNATAFADRYGWEPAATYERNLANGGEKIVLTDAGSNVILEITYNDTLPWPLTDAFP